jgi:GNAT superfamily N-acetyltransferase
MTHATNIRIRPATAADLPQVAAIWHEAQIEDGDEALFAPDVPSLYRHELEHRELHVLERDGQVLAFGALLERGSVRFLADLFVARRERSTGLGRRLLQHLLGRNDGSSCTVSSSDPRALALYVRAGLCPVWPHLSLLADLDALRPLPEHRLEVVPADPDDQGLARWDTAISGRPRLQDHRYWVRCRGGVPLWLVQRTQVVGYAYGQTRSDDLLRHPDAITLGPIGAPTLEQAEACVYAAVEWARPRAAVARIAVTGPHPALGSLLAAGFRFGEVVTFCANDGASFVDVRRYISSGGDLF